MKHDAVLLDTSFFLRFLNEDDPLYKNADGYFRYFLKNEIAMIISTISIAEYCVGGSIAELPLKNLKILPFNLDHAKRTGQFAKIVFAKKDTLNLTIRRIIPMTQNYLHKQILKVQLSTICLQIVRVTRYIPR